MVEFKQGVVQQLSWRPVTIRASSATPSPRSSRAPTLPQVASATLPVPIWSGSPFRACPAATLPP